MKKLSVFPLYLIGATVLLLINPLPIAADPLPTFPDAVLPQVFCFKITDIRADKTDPELNKFTFEFEVLNWSSGFANNVEIMLSQPDTSGVRFTAAGVDADGRPLIIEGVGIEDTNGNGILDPGEDTNGDGRLTDDLMPGNLNTPNEFMVTTQTDTLIFWETEPFPQLIPVLYPSIQLPFIQYAYAGMDPVGIRNADLIGAAAFGGTPAANNRIPGFPGTTTIDGAGNVSPLEAIDNGDNVRDGFTFTVDGLDPGDTFQFNWFLTQTFLTGGDPPTVTIPLGTSFGGNDYGFGVVIISRVDAAALPGPVYIGNLGVQQTGAQFFDSVFIVPDPAGVAAEFGAGLTAPFVKPNDNVFEAGINAIIISTPAVGGEIIPIETTSLLLVSAQTFSWMIPVVLSVIGIGLFVVSRKSENS